ncbi:MAG: hypothetical protein HC927_00480 [Deltaproteobacteria bacterium]|nr:hypothetical protein [Deltaproteobacteria bacterium]
MNENIGEELIHELLADPREFDESGRAYALLQAYFDGLPLSTLRPLLQSQDVFVNRSAAFVASELGAGASTLIDDVIPLLRSPDRHVRYYATEVLTVCAKGDRAKEFAHVMRMLECDDDGLRYLTMHLVSRADVSQLEAARRAFEHLAVPDERHVTGLLTLAAEDRVDPDIVAAMMTDADPLVRRYGAIAAKRTFRHFPALIREAVFSKDSEIRKFCQSVVQDHDSSDD